MIDTEGKFPERKSIRLKNFDYSNTGAYFITICAQDRKCLFSEFVNKKENIDPCAERHRSVGEGLDPPAEKPEEYPKMQLTKIGEIAKEQLLALEARFHNVKIDEYVFMPDHMHAIIFLRKDTGGSRPSPTLMDIIRVYKSLTSRLCKQKFGTEKLFQRSYMEHIIRDKSDYETKRKYIYENPIRWYYNK